MVYTLYGAAWIFTTYSVLGWCVEVAFAACKSGKFVNRGFLNGPVCPIYGFGMLAVLLALTPVADNLALLFFGAALLTTAIEFLTGWLLERLFHQKWWDYSKMPLNIKGYVCLPFSLIWGAACILIVKVIEPGIEKLIGFIPHTLGLVLICIIIPLFVADAVLTFIGVAKLPKRLKAMAEVTEQLRRVSNGIGEGIFEGTMKVREKGEELKTDLAENPKAEQLRARLAALAEKKNVIHDRIIKAFPNLTEDGKFSTELKRLKSAREERAAAKKSK